MLDWKFPDGSWLDGITGEGIGYAQIAVKTARKYGVNGSDYHIIKRLNTYEGRVEITAVILKIMQSLIFECVMGLKMSMAKKLFRD